MPSQLTTKEQREFFEATKKTLLAAFGEQTYSSLEESLKTHKDHEWRDVKTESSKSFNFHLYPPQKGANGRYTLSAWLHCRINNTPKGDNGKRNFHIFFQKTPQEAIDDMLNHLGSLLGFLSPEYNRAFLAVYPENT